MTKKCETKKVTFCDVSKGMGIEAVNENACESFPF